MKHGTVALIPENLAADLAEAATATRSTSAHRTPPHEREYARLHWTRRGSGKVASFGLLSHLHCALRASAFIVLGIVLALRSPAFGSSGDPVAIISPVGWTAVPRDQVIGHGPFAAWLGPFDTAVGFRQNVNVTRRSTTGSLAKDVARNLHEIRAIHPDIAIWESRKNKRCRPTSSWIVSFSYQGDVFVLVHEQVLTASKGAVFIATYTRAFAQRPSHAARDAIERMCPIGRP